MGHDSPRRSPSDALGAVPPRSKRRTDEPADAVADILGGDDLEQHARGKLRAALVRLFRPQETLSEAAVVSAVTDAEAYFLRLRGARASKPPRSAANPARVVRRAPADPERHAQAEQLLAMPGAVRIIPAHGLSREFVEHFATLLAEERDGKRDSAPLADREARLLGIARILGVV